MNVTQDDLDAVLHLFGHESFRPGQKRVIRNLLSKRDVMAVLPTGAGKSLVFQLTAQLLPGVTVVVSPLLALMKDQVESLEAAGFTVAVINSSQSDAEAAREMAEVTDSAAKLLYVTPERFNNPAFMAAMREIDVSLFAVDEAHCVSEWGHDFRPSYLALGRVIEELGHPTILALTATATPWVRREIIDRLGMSNPDIVVRGVDRPNLFFEVLRAETETDERRILHQLFVDGGRDYPNGDGTRLRDVMHGSGIIYCQTTRGARETAELLNEWGIPADYYHGQRKKADRERVQEAFMEGEIRVIAATNAFGLGVDKSDVRFVIHLDVPSSLEAYYQEAGRAGRDGNFARCTLIYRPGDLGRAAFLSGTGSLTEDDLQRVRFGLLHEADTTTQALSERSGLKNGQLERVLLLLEDEGIIERRNGRIQMLVDDFTPGDISLDREVQRRAYERSRLEMMRGYAELTGDCRREYILNYFGQEFENGACGECDVDVLRDPHIGGSEGSADTLTVAVPMPFQMGDRVIHDSWGEGEVQRVADDTLTILFQEAGYKTVATELVIEQGLLQKILPGPEDYAA
jgi:ATP-dependent DNA helicase RecQ